VKEEDATGNAEDVVWKVGDSTQPFEQSSKDGGIAVMKLHSLPLSAVREISAVRMTIPADVMLKAARKNVCKSVAEINRRFPEGLPPLDPINDMKINSPHLTTLIERSAKLGEALSAHGFSKLGKEEKKEKLDLYEEKQELLDKGKLMRRKVRPRTKGGLGLHVRTQAPFVSKEREGRVDKRALHNHLTVPPTMCVGPYLTLASLVHR